MFTAVTRRSFRLRNVPLRSFTSKDKAAPSPSPKPPPQPAAATKDATAPPPPSAETEDPSKHSSDIAFKPNESGWGYSRSYSGGYENIFGKRSSKAGTHTAETATVADKNNSRGFDGIFGRNVGGGEKAAATGSHERREISDFERGYAAGYEAGIAAGSDGKEESRQI